MVDYLLVIVAGTIGGLGAHHLNIPGGAVVGAMLGSGLVSILLPEGMTLPPRAAVAIQIVLGITLGMTFNRAFLALGPKALPLAILSTIILLCVAVCMAYMASRLGLVDFGTALFGFSPGGMTGMAILAQTEGQHGSVVAFFHLIRVFTLFVSVPLLVRIVEYLRIKF